MRFKKRTRDSVSYLAEGVKYVRDRDEGGPSEWWVKHSGRNWERVRDVETILALENEHDRWMQDRKIAA